MAIRTKGAIRTTLSTITTTAEVVDLAMQIVKANLQISLEEELFEAEATRAELNQRRASLASIASAESSDSAL